MPLLSAEPLNTYSLRFTLSPGHPVIVIVSGAQPEADRTRLLEAVGLLLESRPKADPPKADPPAKTTKRKPRATH